ncbi:hypothetical protein SteCoe_6014 [Stentor coeruleus]|uniref:Uncharacterized protein n=1 Tax=Stentor coeruleus TaxID=5963 RepID=A0A1R2CR00_9CILI|nr:hypothetical protein SteCoe_6014 [Stentor coeruleus]
MSSTETSLKNLNLIEDLKENSKLLKFAYEAKSQTWLENLNSLKEKENYHKTLTEDLKFCNSIFQDLIIRLNLIGEKNESIVVDKLWRYVLHTFDQYLETLTKKPEKIQIIDVESPKITRLKTECKKKVNKIEKEINRIKLDFTTTKKPLISTVKVEKDEVFPYVDKVYMYLNELNILCKRKNNHDKEGNEGLEEENDEDTDKLEKNSNFIEGINTNISKSSGIRLEIADEINN